MPEWLWQGLTVEMIGVAVELALVFLVIGIFASLRENWKWRPSRVQITKSLVRAHSEIFNACKNGMEPDHNVLLQVDKGLSDAEKITKVWAMRVHFTRQLAPDHTGIEKLKKLVELNNQALNSDFLPLITEFIVAAEALVKSTLFFIESYHPSNNAKRSGFAPFEEISKMEVNVKKLLELLPELKDVHEFQPYVLPTAPQLIEIFQRAGSENAGIELMINNSEIRV